MRLGVDPRKADQMVRGTVNLPHGTGKTARVLVFATGDRAGGREAAGADIVGADELIDEVAKGRLDFDAVVATPDLMGKVGRLGRVLGPRGLMPNPKTGTVTPDVAKAVTEIKGGKIEFRVDKHSNLHFIIGKASFDETQLVENYAAALDEVLPAQAVGRQGPLHQEGAIATTMGPGIPLDPNRTRNLPRRGDRRRLTPDRRAAAVRVPCERAPLRLGGRGARPFSTAGSPSGRPRTAGRFACPTPFRVTYGRTAKDRSSPLPPHSVAERSAECGRPAQVTVDSRPRTSVESTPRAPAPGRSVVRAASERPHHPEGGRPWRGRTRQPRSPS